jgi:hypothetical protein
MIQDARVARFVTKYFLLTGGLRLPNEELQLPGLATHKWLRQCIAIR